MTRVVVDASVLGAVTSAEPDAPSWVRRLEGAAVFAPRLLLHELQSVAWKSCRQHPARAPQIVSALAAAPYLIVNGVVVIDQGEHTGQLPGQVLRGPAWRAGDLQRPVSASR